ncbi:hypothetical protein [Spirosoma validum]|uniref:Uncharacterized protein n=1 Tax=Spirosoma validum TaxID=2771355 RepID=A0A927B1X1_9BACT|nr:hypothetical protein [Spirosoma validum]MBD2754054.1 hypothetical protein [Spirosoma validum]
MKTGRSKSLDLDFLQDDDMFTGDEGAFDNNWLVSAGDLFGQMDDLIDE